MVYNLLGGYSGCVDKGSRKKSSFLTAEQFKDLPPPHLEINGSREKSFKSSDLLNGTTFTPPPRRAVMAMSLQKRFFCASLRLNYIRSGTL